MTSTPRFVLLGFMAALASVGCQKTNPPPAADEKFGAAYFAARKALEPKHGMEAAQWRDYFHPRTALDAGCGAGQRVLTLNEAGIDAEGFDISNDAINNSPFKAKLGDKLWVGDITVPSTKRQYDLVIVYDVFEHIPYELLDKAIGNVYSYVNPGKNVVISVPVIGDPNLDRDSTHIVKETMAWWIKKVESAGFHVIPTPPNFLFAHQMIIARKD
jgi:2-polyprenyl-3-methyl-5-hydroxy-6-metoxy-1,4-benzoquinol methylase